MLLPMKYAVDSEHRDFFQKHRFLELEELLTPKQLEEANAAIEAALKVRLSVNQLDQQSAENLFMAGRDLWRQDQQLRKLICQRGLAEIASELISVKPIALAFDQLIVSPDLHPLVTADNRAYIDLMKTPTSLEEISSVQGLVCGLLLCLRAGEPHPLFPSVAGHGVYFDPKVPLDFGFLRRDRERRLLLIAYAEKSSYYYQQNNDPHLHYLKRFGYHFGDKLSIKHIPPVFE
jgi:hypothetical protein